VKTLAIIASRGSFNSLVQVVTLLMAAVASGVAVSVFFRDEAVLKVTKTGAREINLSEVYRGHEEAVQRRLSAQELADLPRALRKVQELGEVKLYACSSSMAICGVEAMDLLDGIEVRGLTAFLLEEVATADRVLTF
jgi:peroxiredoxin family protein